MMQHQKIEKKITDLICGNFFLIFFLENLNLKKKKKTENLLQNSSFQFLRSNFCKCSPPKKIKIKPANN
jgi:hypothetical protein